MPSPVGAEIRRAREGAGIGLRELARRIQKSPAFLVELERSETAPGITESTLKAIADELSLDINLLMSLVSKIPASVKPRTPLEIELYSVVRTLSVEQQQALLDSLKAESREGAQPNGTETDDE